MGLQWYCPLWFYQAPLLPLSHGNCFKYMFCRLEDYTNKTRVCFTKTKIEKTFLNRVSEMYGQLRMKPISLLGLNLQFMPKKLSTLNTNQYKMINLAASLFIRLFQFVVFHCYVYSFKRFAAKEKCIFNQKLVFM